MSYKNLTEFCHELERNIDVHDIANYLELKKGSGTSSFFCPFHEDNSPSFIAKRGYQVWNCASHCGSGNLYQLVQRVKNISYIDAVKEVASIANISFDIEELDKIKQIEKDLTPLQEIHLDYLINKRGWDKQTIEELKPKAWRKYIVVPNIKNNEILNYKYLPIFRKKKDPDNPDKEKEVSHYFRGNDTSCCFYPDNNFKDTEILILVAGEWDTGRMKQLIRNNKDKVNYKIVSCSAGEKSSPLDMLVQLNKRNAPKLQEVWIYYDHDKTGKEGSYRIADKLCVLNIPIWINFFPEENKKGYDITDFANDGYSFEDLKNLKKIKYDPRQKDIKVTGSDFNTERECLLFLLANNKCINDFDSENIRVSDFKDWRFQEVYKKIREFIADFNYCDIDLLKHRIHDGNLQEAINEIIGARHINIEELFDNFKQIQISSYEKAYTLALSQMQTILHAGFKNIDDVQNKTLEIFDKLLAEATYNDKTSSMDEILDDYANTFHDNKLRYITSPFREVNEVLNPGWRVGKVHIVSGEVSLGKSIFARQQAEFSAEQKVETMLYVTEAEKEEIAENVMASRTSINNYHYKTRRLPKDQTLDELRLKAKKDTDKRYFFVREAFDMNFKELCNDIRMQVRKRNIKLIILDQLTSIPTEGNMNRKDFITKCMNTLVRLAAKENICIILVSQLKREKQGKSGNMFDSTESNDLAESSDLERLAFTIAVLTANEKHPDLIRIWFPKNRNYIKNLKAEVHSQKEYSKFSDRLSKF